MTDNARDTYLEAQVMTATPQKLRLMLIDGAIRFARQAADAWERGRDEQAFEAIVRARRIVTELLSSLRTNQSALARRVAGIYVFLFRALTEAQLRRAPEKLNEVLRVLEVERETWRLVCERMAAAPPAAAPDKPPPAEKPGAGGPAESEGLALDA